MRGEGKEKVDVERKAEVEDIGEGGKEKEGRDGEKRKRGREKGIGEREGERKGREEKGG